MVVVRSAHLVFRFGLDYLSNLADSRWMMFFRGEQHASKCVGSQLPTGVGPFAAGTSRGEIGQFMGHLIGWLFGQSGDQQVRFRSVKRLT